MRILIVGLGSIGQRHARNLRALLGPDLELLACRVRGRPHVITPELEMDSSRDVEREYGIRAFRELNAALAERPEIAFIANPSSMHVPAALACARAGCDLFVEKPLSDSLAGVEELIAAVEERRRIAMVGYQLRFHPCFAALGGVLEQGRIGRPLAVRSVVGEYLPDWHRYEDYRATYAARADLGGGAVLSQIHEFDYLYALFGLPRRVWAVGGHWSGLEIDVEDVCSALMEFCPAGRPLAVHLHLDYLQRPPVRQCEVVGERGKALADFRQLRVSVWEEGRLSECFDFRGLERNRLFVEELRHFLRCVERREKPVVDLRDGAASLRLALAVKAAMSTGRMGDLDVLGTRPL